MIVAGITKVVTNENPNGLLSLLEHFQSNNISASIQNKKSDALILLYTEYTGDHTAAYTLVIGHEVSSSAAQGDDIEIFEFDNSSHTQHHITGSIPEAVVNKWQEIWQSDAKRAYIADYDVYNLDGTVDIFVEYL